MTARRVTIPALDALSRARRKAFQREIADVVAARLRNEGLARVIAEWEAEHGTITNDELADVDREIDDARRRSARTSRVRQR
jgi:hypothetical protein